MDRRLRRGRSSLTFAAAALILASACAEQAPGDAAASTGSAGETASTGPTGATATTGPSGGGGGRSDYGMGDGGGGGRYDYGTDDGGAAGEGGDGDVTLAADNFAFDPGEIELAAGAEISVKNANAGTPHTFTVEGTDIDLELDPGEVETTTLDVDPGTYAFLCRFHPQMTGTLTVE